jgi:hypothetical protein
LIVMPRFHSFLGALKVAVALCIGVNSAGAAVPSAEKIADAVAETNRLSGRSDPVLFEVTLRIGDGEPVATGVLASHPTGLARLELRSRRGFVERHLLQGDAYTASRDGQLLDPPHPFLPPTFFLFRFRVRIFLFVWFAHTGIYLGSNISDIMIRKLFSLSTC